MLILFLPLIGAIIRGFFGNQIGSYGSVQITTWNVFISCLLSSVAFYEVGLLGSPCYVTLFTWRESELFYYLYNNEY